MVGIHTRVGEESILERWGLHQLSPRHHIRRGVAEVVVLAPATSAHLLGTEIPLVGIVGRLNLKT